MLIIVGILDIFFKPCSVNAVEYRKLNNKCFKLNICYVGNKFSGTFDKIDCGDMK